MESRVEAAYALLCGSMLLILSCTSMIQVAKAEDPELNVTVETNKCVYSFGRLVRIEGIVTNSTHHPMVEAWVGIQVQDPNNGTVFLDIAVSSADGNYSASFRLPSTAILGSYQIYVTVSVPQYPTAKQQHTFIVTIQGDVDGNGTVDIFDVVRMASVYGISHPDPRYDPDCDLDDDWDIDIFDVVLAAGHYGESW